MRSVLRLVRLLPLAFALPLVFTAPLRAQDQVEPWVEYVPGTTTFSSPSVPVTVRFRDETSLNVSTRVITFNGVNVTGSFSHTAPASSMGWVLSTSTATLTLQPGANTLSASIKDQAGNSSVAWSVTYTYVPGNPAVKVTPDGAAVQKQTGSQHAHTFRVWNPGAAEQTYALRVSCRDAWSAAMVGGCSAPSTVTVPAGDSAAVTVSVPAGAAGTERVVRLDAWVAGEPGVADAGWIDVTSTGTGGGAAVPTVQLVDLNTGAVIERGECVTVAVATRAAYECGDLRLAHGLPAHRTMNRTWAPVLLFNQQHAHPRPIVYADVTLPATADAPTRYDVTVQLLDGGANQTRSFTGGDWAPGTTRRVAVAWDGLSLATGLYRYQLQVAAVYPGQTLSVTTDTAELAVVNRSGSAFGLGWWVAGWERLVHVSDSRLLWVGGDGSTRVFAPNGSARWTAWNPGGAPDTLRLATVGGVPRYTRKLNGGGEIHFDAAGVHLRTVNRLGQETTFAHTGGRLDSITAPTAGANAPSWWFAYDGTGRLTHADALAPGGATRRVVLGHGLGGRRVTSITDPDTVSVAFTYDGSSTRRIVSVTDRRGTYTSFTFAPGSKLASARLRMGSVASSADIIRTFQAAESKGVGGSVARSQAYTLLDGPQDTLQDHTYLWLTARGAPRRIRDASGAETVLVRGESAFPSLVTQVLGPNARGDSLVLKSSADYDGRGRITIATTHNPLGDGQNVFTRYGWNNTSLYGHLRAEPTAYVSGAGIYQPQAPRTLLVDNDEPCEKFTTAFARAAQQINASDIIYNPFATNSNAAARYMLREAGFADVSRPWCAIMPGWHNALNVTINGGGGW